MAQDATDGARGTEPGPAGPAGARGWPLVLVLVAGLALAGWAYLGVMVADMVPLMDMSEAGPGMGLFNQFNGFAGLPAEARAALAALCLPTAAATFGMPSVEWSIGDAFVVFVMWLMMALAMMLPGATPMLRAYHERSAAVHAASAVSTLTVAAGYLAVWAGYAVVATAVQWALTQIGALSTMMAPVHLALTASVLVGAGIYQFTPAKRACLDRCWYPRWLFLNLRHKETGGSAAFREGIAQGLACLGCCWAVMTVMFAVGLMNIVWIAVLGAVMAIEKAFPSRVLPPLLGALFLAWGGALTALLMTGAG
ncbi:MAG: DUF2182 domain-containing protein [Roseibium sp.]|nr:DUF2182 domain-containing protein [Roseibium sp.]